MDGRPSRMAARFYCMGIRPGWCLGFFCSSTQLRPAAGGVRRAGAGAAGGRCRLPVRPTHGGRVSAALSAGLAGEPGPDRANYRTRAVAVVLVQCAACALPWRDLELHNMFRGLHRGSLHRGRSARASFSASSGRSRGRRRTLSPQLGAWRWAEAASALRPCRC